jgi:hypothetical protein
MNLKITGNADEENHNFLKEKVQIALNGKLYNKKWLLEKLDELLVR